MNVLDVIRGKRQSAEEAARKRYRALILKAAANGGELSPKEAEEVDQAATALGYNPDDMQAHITAATEAEAARETAATYGEHKAAMRKAAEERDAIGAAKVKAVQEFEAKWGAAEVLRAKEAAAASAASVASGRLSELATAHPWLIEAEVK